MNRTNFLSQKAMRKNGNTSNRTEQLLIGEIIEHHSTKFTEITYEKKISYTREDGSTRDATPDITVYHEKLEKRSQLIVIRVMGEYHDGKRQSRKDEVQLEYLNKLFDHVIDIWYWEAPYTFKRRNEKLTKNQLEKSHAEIKRALSGIIALCKPSNFWYQNTKHLKSK